MNKALRLELNTISEIQGKIYPTHAPMGVKPPFLVYISQENLDLVTLDGIQNGEAETNYLFNPLAEKFSEIEDLNKIIKNKLLTFPKRFIGDGSIFIKDMKINNITSTFESELNLYRGIIDVEFSYKEEI